MIALTKPAITGAWARSISAPGWVQVFASTARTYADVRGRRAGALYLDPVAAALSLSRRTLYSFAKEYRISFKKPTRGSANDAARSEQAQARDAKYAERIRAFLELGISRRQCCGRLAIGNKAFERIIAAYGIDYPKRS
eukprot:gene9839-11498_t